METTTAPRTRPPRAARELGAHARVAALAGVPLLAGLDESRLAALAAKARERHFQERSVIVCEGGESPHLHVVVSGLVRIYASEDGREVTFGFRGPGEHFGEVALLDGGPQPASAATLARTLVLAVPAEALLHEMSACPALALAVAREIAGHARGLAESLKTFALKDVYGRLSATLVRLASEQDGELVVHGRITQQDLAELVGASRAMVGRVMKELVTGGYVSWGSAGLTLHRRLPERW